MDTERSRNLFHRAQRRIPGGVNSPVRAFKAVGGHPRFIDRGEGAYMVDVDGHRYVDHVMSWGALILGHAHASVVADLTETLRLRVKAENLFDETYVASIDPAGLRPGKPQEILVGLEVRF
mgnify:CR=1 FL=1